MKTRFALACAALGLIVACATPTTAPNITPATLLTFSFGSLKISGTISGTAVSVGVPAGTDVTDLTPTFTSTGSVEVAGVLQTSGTTAHDFTSPVAYVVTSTSGATKTYTVTVTIGSPMLTYDGNGNDSGSAPNSTAHAMNSTVVLSDPSTLALTDFVFAAWNTKADGTGTVIYPGESITITANQTTLYAMWESAPGGDWTSPLASATGTFYIPYGVTSLTTVTIASMPSVTTVVLPPTVTSAANAFTTATSLTAIQVSPANTKYYAQAGVLYSSTKTLVAYPIGLTGAFTVPSGVLDIGNQAFSNCTGLTAVTLPETVTTIEGYAFSASGVTSVSLPSSLTTLKTAAFVNTQLTTLTIPAGVTTVGLTVFALDVNLTTVTMLGTTPPTGGSSLFYDSSSIAHIYVPASAVSAYQAAAGWSDYSTLISAAP
jgi:hypothetical protein